MTTNYLETVKELFADPSSLTPEKVQALVSETTEYLSDLQARFGSEDTEVREEAMKMALEVQTGLANETKSLFTRLGIDPTEIAGLSASMGSEHKEIVKEAEAKFSQFLSKSEESKPLKSRHNNKIKLVG